MVDYFDAYMKAVTNPLPELKKTFEKELELITKYFDIMTNNHRDGSERVLDLGCGSGRVLNKFVRFNFLQVINSSPYYSLNVNKPNCIGIDSDYRMTEKAIQNFSEWVKENYSYRESHDYEYQVARELAQSSFIYRSFESLPDTPEWDLVYSAYNTIGGFSPEKQEEFIEKKSKLTRDKGYIITSTWSQSDKTTDFLKEYYKDIGVEILEFHKDRTVLKVSDGEIMSWYRLSIDRIVDLYEKNNIEFIECRNLKHFNGIVGRKR